MASTELRALQALSKERCAAEAELTQRYCVVLQTLAHTPSLETTVAAG